MQAQFDRIVSPTDSLVRGSSVETFFSPSRELTNQLLAEFTTLEDLNIQSPKSFTDTIRFYLSNIASLPAYFSTLVALRIIGDSGASKGDPVSTPEGLSSRLSQTIYSRLATKADAPILVSGGQMSIKDLLGANILKDIGYPSVSPEKEAVFLDQIREEFRKQVLHQGGQITTGWGTISLCGRNQDSLRISRHAS